MTAVNRKAMRSVILLPLLLLLALFAGKTATTQTTSGTVIGTLQDQTGATVANAE